MLNKLILVASIVISSVSQAETISRAETIWDYLPSKNQQKLREEKRYTVGLPISAPYNLPGQYQFRPNGRWTLGGSFAAEELSNETLDGKLYNTVSGDQSSASLYFEHYVPRAYGFHVGAGIEHRSGTFTVLTASSTDEGSEEKLTEGQFSAVYAGPSFGFTWIWDWGLTLGFDVSARKRFSHSYQTDGEVSKKVKDAIVPKTTSGMLLLGYSF